MYMAPLVKGGSRLEKFQVCTGYQTYVGKSRDQDLRWRYCLSQAGLSGGPVCSTAFYDLHFFHSLIRTLIFPHMCSREGGYLELMEELFSLEFSGADVQEVNPVAVEASDTNLMALLTVDKQRVKSFSLELHGFGLQWLQNEVLSFLPTTQWTTLPAMTSLISVRASECNRKHKKHTGHK